MKKNCLFFICLLLFAALFFASCGGDPIEDDPTLGMTCVCAGSLDTTKADIKKINVLFDNSGSMKGYFYFKSMHDAKKTINEVLLNGIVKMGVSDSSLMFTCGDKSWTNIKDVSEEFKNCGLLNGSETRLDKLIEAAVAQADETSVSILVSDMVLSYGLAALKIDINRNRHYLSDLGADVVRISTECKNKGMHLVILQYYSDYNGNYYCNCTENLQGKELYKGVLMKDRPFYIVAVGKPEALKKVVNSFEKPNGIYATFQVEESDYVNSKFAIKPNSPGWRDVEEGKYDVWSSGDLNDDTCTFALKFDAIALPNYLNGNVYVECHSNEYVTDCSYNGENEIVLKLKPYSELDDISPISVSLLINGATGINADIMEDAAITDVDILKRKTFGFGTIQGAFNEIYKKQPDTVATFKFRIIKTENI